MNMNQNPSEGVRKPVLYAVWLLILVAIAGVVAVRLFNREKPAPPVAENTDETPASSQGSASPKPLHAASASDSGEPGATAPVTPAPVPPAPRAKAPAPVPPP